MASFILLPADTIGATFGLEMLRALSYAPTIPLIWAMFADVADYAEWKTGRRATGVVFATILFALKTGLSFGGAFAGWLLVGLRLSARTSRRRANALLGIRLTASVVPGGLPRDRRRVPVPLHDHEGARDADRHRARGSVGEATADAVARVARHGEPHVAVGRSRLARALLAAASWRDRVRASAPIAQAHSAPTLKDAFAGAFRVGAALNANQFTERDAKGAALVKAQFNTITPENVLKWEVVHPQPSDVRLRASPTSYVAFGEANGMFIVGHTLVWHSQTPRWVFQDANGAPLTRDALLARMRDHIHDGRRPLQGAHQGLGRRQRSAERRRHDAALAVVHHHRRRLHREGIPVRARGRSGRGAVLQRLQSRGAPRSATARPSW